MLDIPKFKTLTTIALLTYASYGFGQRSQDFPSNDSISQRGAPSISNQFIGDETVSPSRSALRESFKKAHPISNIISIPYKIEPNDESTPAGTQELTEEQLIALIANDSTSNNSLNLPETLPLRGIFNFEKVTYQYLDSGEGESSFIITKVITEDGLPLTFEDLEPDIQQQISQQLESYLQNLPNPTLSQD